jgi:predicted AlkP superfamily pyrophosphatase or phosphodiesterase
LISLLKNGIYSWEAKTEIQTISGPAWTALLVGVHSDKSNVFGNDFKPRNMDFKSIFYLIKQWNPKKKCVAHSNWKPIITKIAEKKTLDRKSSGSDKKMAQNLIKDITRDKGDLYFIQLDEIDGAGHSHTYSPDSKKYLAVIEQSDKYIGDILKAVENRPNDEDWLICLVSDHGGNGKGHGKPTILN